MFEELIEWIKLPQDLQHRFFELTEQEANRLVEDVQKIDMQLKELSKELQTYIYK